MVYLLATLLVVGASPDSGYLTVRSDMPGLAVYLEGEYLGRTPIERHRLETGSYWLALVSEDSLDIVYDNFNKGGISRKVSSALSLVGINAGSQRVKVNPGAVTEVSIDYGEVRTAPTRVKWYACCGVGGVFGLGAVVGFLIGLLVS